MSNLPDEEISPLTRQLFEDIYSVPVQSQIAFEKNPLSRKSAEIFREFAPQSYHSYSGRHSYKSKVTTIREEIVIYGVWRKSDDLRKIELLSTDPGKRPTCAVPNVEVFLNFIMGPLNDVVPEAA